MKKTDPKENSWENFDFGLDKLPKFVIETPEETKKRKLDEEETRKAYAQLDREHVYGIRSTRIK